MLGAEQEIIANYVDEGLVRIVFWPVLDHGNASLNSHAAADCMGRQDADAFWSAHDQFFLNQDELWQADKAYFVDVAATHGLDLESFEACYDSGTGHATVTELDSIRRDRGVFNRPTFNINDQLLVGSQPFSVFQDYIQAALDLGT